MSLMRNAARTAGRTAIITGTAARTHQRVASRQQAQFAQQTAAPVAPAPAAPVAPPPVAPAAPAPAPKDTATMIEQLKQLGELRDAGVLSDIEFEIQKAKILA